MKVYIDNENRCHTTTEGTFREVEHPFFDGKCQTFIDGYCYDDSSGKVAIYPWKPSNELENAQHNHEKQMLADYETALAEIEAALGV